MGLACRPKLRDYLFILRRFRVAAEKCYVSDLLFVSGTVFAQVCGDENPLAGFGGADSMTLRCI
jgi:hypothetical protein